MCFEFFLVKTLTKLQIVEYNGKIYNNYVMIPFHCPIYQATISNFKVKNCDTNLATCLVEGILDLTILDIMFKILSSEAQVVPTTKLML